MGAGTGAAPGMATGSGAAWRGAAMPAGWFAPGRGWTGGSGAAMGSGMPGIGATAAWRCWLARPCGIMPPDFARPRR